jgi:hypothetical protein
MTVIERGIWVGCRFILIGSFCLAVAAAPVRADSAATFSLVDSDIVIDAGAANGTAAMLLKADGLNDDDRKAPLGQPTDLKVPAATNVEFAVHELDGANASRRWLLTADIKGLPRDSSQKRYLSFDFKGQTVTLPYTLSNKPAGSFAWSVKGPPTELSLKAGEAMEINIAVQAIAATHVRVLQTSLLEQTRKTLLDGGLTLCATPAASSCTDAGIDLAANSTNRLWLRTHPDSTIVGRYDGTVIIGATEKPDGETLTLIIYGTTVCRQLLGVLVIIIGVACAWFVSTWSQNRLNRDQALLPAIVLADRVRALQKILENAPPNANATDWPHTTEELKTLAKNLSEDELTRENFLPPATPSPFKGAGPDIDGYKQLLANAAAKIALLECLIDTGFAAIWKKIPSAPNDAARQAISEALGAIDAEAAKAPVPSPSAEGSIIQGVLTKLDADLAKAGLAVAAAAAAGARAQPRTFQQITVEIRNLSGLVWFIFGGLAAAVGAYIVVVNNLGFGVLSDYFFCLFWGFGLPASGQQLAQSTMASVGTTLGIATPKSQP